MKKKSPVVRYQNKTLLFALGQHCRALRLKKGLSIDRMTKSGERLSPGAIQRLETGEADVQFSLLYRYSQVLEIPLKQLLDFDYSKAEDQVEILPFEEGTRAPKGAVPFYSIEVAAGIFKNENYYTDPQGWVIVDRRGSLRDFFAVQITGKSMEPTIQDKSICLFKKYSGGSRNGQIMLVQAKGLVDPESGGNFVVKRYKRINSLTTEKSPAEKNITDENSREGVIIHLLSDNPKFAPIILTRAHEDMVSTPAIFIEVL